MKRAVLVGLLFCSAAVFAQTPPPPQPAEPAQPTEPAQPARPEPGFVIEHVPPRLSPDAQRTEDRCVRTTTSHAATDRASRPTKGTRGTHGACAGQGFRGDGGADIESGLQGPALTR